jgi:shikimate dehydrogenase
MHKITGTTKLLGLFGYPVEHTLSPAMHNVALEKLGLDYVYVPFSVKPENVHQAVNSIRTLNLAGVNVTVPHKEAVIQFLDSVDRLAGRIGAVNTIVNDNGKLTGYNTDGLGFIKSLADKKFNVKNKTVLLIGAGGAGKAIAVTLVESGIKELYILEPDTARVNVLTKNLARTNRKVAVNRINQINRELMLKIGLLVNATPVGMKPGSKCVITPDLLNHNKNLFVYDIVYNRETELVKESKKRRIRFLSGIDMLLYQGVAAFELWLNKKPPAQLMRRVLMKNIA